MTLSHCSGVRCSKRPSGTHRTGGKMPKVSVYRKEGDEMTVVGKSTTIGVPARTVARMRRQRINHEPATPTNPIAHNVPRVRGRLFMLGVIGWDGAASTRTVNGWLS